MVKTKKTFKAAQVKQVPNTQLPLVTGGQESKHIGNVKYAD
jgi:hypothetical protein